MNSHKVEINKSFALWKKVGILSYFYSAIRPSTPPQSAPFRNGPECIHVPIGANSIYNAISFSFRFASAAVSKDGELMCGGFEDSAVRLWSLTQKKLAVNKQTFTELSQVNLGIGTVTYKLI